MTEIVFERRVIEGAAPAPLHADDITEVRLDRMPPEVVLRDGEVCFIAATERPWLALFSRANDLVLAHRVDVWSELAEPFLDTELTDEIAARRLQRLARCGLDEREVERLRARIGPTMLRYTASTRECSHYGHQDVLVAMSRTLSPPAFEVFRRESMPIAASGVLEAPRDMPLRERMRLRWENLASELKLPFEPAQDAGAQLMDAYGAPSRHYHDLDHVRVVLGHARALAARHDDRTAVALAAWFHDAIYDAGRPDNEARSVDMMRELLVPLGAAEPVLARAGALILRTAEPKGARDPSEEALVDADFSIVGETAEVYDRYAAAVRREYGVYSDAAFQQGRAAFIDSLLAHRDARGRLFYRLPPLCEALAAGNLARERAQLS